jgi:hypothetical protein
MDGTQSIANGVGTLAEGKGVTRLCHLTPLRNLVHLATDGRGLMSLRQLAETAGDFNQQDLVRLDNHPDHLCCSIEYPNGWYLKQRKMKATPIERLFPDWVCLAIEPSHLSRKSTRVCVRNAAAEGGRLLVDVSPEAFEALYSSPIRGAGGRFYARQPTRLRACPTDDQAEVLVHRLIPMSDIATVIVKSESDAKRFYAALTQLGAKIEDLAWAIAPVLFTSRQLSNSVARGVRPDETPWRPQ